MEQIDDRLNAIIQHFLKIGFVQTKLDARNIPNVHFDVKDDYSVLAQRSYAF